MYINNKTECLSKHIAHMTLYSIKMHFTVHCLRKYKISRVTTTVHWMDMECEICTVQPVNTIWDMQYPQYNQGTLYGICNIHHINREHYMGYQYPQYNQKKLFAFMSLEISTTSFTVWMYPIVKAHHYYWLA